MTAVAGADETATVINRQRSVKIAPRGLQGFLKRICDELGLAETELVICFVTDAEIARMNEAYRKKSGPTDVLSFPAVAQRKIRGARERRGTPYLGDIAIAPLVARRNARTYGRKLATELRILMLHGVLHLLGYDHETDHGEMNRLEMKLRRRFGLA